MKSFTEDCVCVHISNDKIVYQDDKICHDSLPEAFIFKGTFFLRYYTNMGYVYYYLGLVYNCLKFN
jgi:hypothetical protein